MMSIILVGLVSAQISPGKLAEPHAHLEGISNCTKCHILGDRGSNEMCLNCHHEIATLITEQRGYHSSAEVRTSDCYECHSDHHGREFQMIRFDTLQFDHVSTGYDLLGAHAELNCRKCHVPEFIKDQQIRTKASTYLGLDRDCLSCHTDPHQGTLSTDCSSCHDNKTFKPASKFDHRNTPFPLIGKHSKVNCIECHKIKQVKGIVLQEFAGVAHNNCTSCHKDVHDNKFGQNCVQCHTEESFLKIRQSGNFNHSLTDFPLEGKHQDVACSGCHKTAYTVPIKYNHCSDCHYDYHDKQFVRQDDSPDCSDCHSTHGFERTDFSIEKHNQTDFALTGAHLATPCLSCHMKNSKWSFRHTGKNCMDCHENIHEPYLDTTYYQENGCVSCHNSKRWDEINFDHLKTNFRLEGAHLNQSCRACHSKMDESGNAYQQFSRLSSSCVSCHQDVHNGQFMTAEETICLKCHGYSDWSASKFDHTRAAFKLEGEHNNVACKKCHLPTITSNITYIQYKLKDFSCESCH